MNDFFRRNALTIFAALACGAGLAQAKRSQLSSAARAEEESSARAIAEQKLEALERMSEADRAGLERRVAELSGRIEAVPLPSVDHRLVAAPPTKAPEATGQTEAELRKSMEEFIAEKLYESARARMKACEFQAALDDLESARRLDPGSVIIRDLYNEVSRVMNRKPGEWGKATPEPSTQTSVQIAQTRIEVENHMAEGDRLFLVQRYADAAPEYDDVVAKLKWIPYDVGMNETLETAKLRARSAREWASAEFLDGTSIGRNVDSHEDPPVDVIGETGVFTREHALNGAVFYDIRSRSTVAGSLNQGDGYAVPEELPSNPQRFEGGLNQGVDYQPPPEPGP